MRSIFSCENGDFHWIEGKEREGEGELYGYYRRERAYSFEKVYWGEIFFYLKEKRPRVWKEKRK